MAYTRVLTEGVFPGVDWKPAPFEMGWKKREVSKISIDFKPGLYHQMNLGDGPVVFMILVRKWRMKRKE